MNAVKTRVVCCMFISMAVTMDAVGGPAPTPKAPPESPKVGEPAPALRFAGLLQAPAETKVDWTSLRGKVVVLEFWATWCGPCVRSIPGMNKLEAAHENDPIVFIHVTDEEESVVTKFLKKTPMHGWVGIDDGGKTFTNYAVNGRPKIAVVGKDGTFLGWHDPRFLVLEPDILEEVLTTGSSDRLWPIQGEHDDPLAGVARRDPDGGKTRNLCDIVIRRSDTSSAKRQGGGDSSGNWSFDRPIRKHIANFCDVQSTRMIDTVGLPEEHYDVIALGAHGSSPAMREAVCRLIGATFELALVREKRLMDVFLLATLPQREPTLTPSWGGVYSDAETHLSAPSMEILERMKNGDNYFFALCPLSMLADGVSRPAGKPVISELGDLLEKADDVYSFCFPYPAEEPDGFLRALEEHVGLTLTPAKREVEVLVIRPAGPAPSPIGN